MRRAGVVVLGALTAWIGTGLLCSFALTHRMRAPVDEPAPPGFAPVRLRSRDGIEIGGWWSRDLGAAVGVVLAHGNGSSRTALLPRASALRAMGCDVLSISLRAHGDSGGDLNDLGFGARSDVAAAVQALREADPVRPVVVLGVSLGSAAALFAAADERAPIDGLILVAPYADLRTAVRRRTRRYLPPGVEAAAYGALLLASRVTLPHLDRIRPVDAAGRLPERLPVLIAYGTRDTRATRADAEAIAAAHPGTTLFEVPDAEHEDMEAWDASPEGHEALAAFLRARTAR